MAVPLHLQLSERVMELLEAGHNRQTYQDILDNGTIKQIQVPTKSFQLQGEIFISSRDIYDNLSTAGWKMVITIQQELVMNNPLWHCKDFAKHRKRGTIGELTRKGIISKVGDTDIFLVNPAKIRKGRPLSVYGALYTYAKRMYLKDKKWKPTTEDIIRLVAPNTLAIEKENIFGQ